jgi:hypothetical protein
MRKRNDAPPQQIPVLDLNLSAYLHLRGNTLRCNYKAPGYLPLMQMKPLWTVPRIHPNALVGCLDFVQCGRELKANDEPQERDRYGKSREG